LERGEKKEKKFSPGSRKNGKSDYLCSPVRKKREEIKVNGMPPSGADDIPRVL